MILDALPSDGPFQHLSSAAFFVPLPSRSGDYAMSQWPLVTNTLAAKGTSNLASLIFSAWMAPGQLLDVTVPSESSHSFRTYVPCSLLCLGQILFKNR